MFALTAPFPLTNIADVFRRSSMYIASIMLGAFAADIVLRESYDRFWDKLNEGVSSHRIPVSFPDFRLSRESKSSQRQWKDIKGKYT